MDKDKLWQAVLAQLQLTVSKPNLSIWFDKTFIKTLKAHDDRQLVEVACRNQFIADQLRKNYLPELTEIFSRLTEKKTQVSFVVSSLAKNLASQTSGPLFTFDPEKEKQQLLSSALARARINANYTFANFAVASTNEMAYTAAITIAKTPGDRYNPFFIYGGVGVGKTHLMQAIGIEVLNRDPTFSLLYCTGEEFTNEIIEAINSKNTGTFKRKFRNAKLLMIDDIQFIAGRDFVQEEFFHTFNSIKQLGGQIIMTSDRLPEQIAGLEARLRSRFEGGLMIDIQEPNFELRTAILIIKAKQKGEVLPIEAAKLIAQQVQSTRKLEGVLVRILSEKGLDKKPIDVELVKRVLDKVSLAPPAVRPTMTAQKIIETVALYYQLKLSEIKGLRRLKQIVFPRQVAIYLLRTELKLPYQEIGRLFGGKDHTTIMHSENKIQQMLESSSQVKEEVNALWKTLGKTSG